MIQPIVRPTFIMNPVSNSSEFGVSLIQSINLWDWRSTGGLVRFAGQDIAIYLSRTQQTQWVATQDGCSHTEPIIFCRVNRFSSSNVTRNRNE